MAMQLPVLATNWSGSTEFLNEENSYPIKIDSLVPVKSGAFKGHLWAQPSVAHLRQLLRRVVENPEEAAAKGRRARADMVKYYSPEVVSEMVLEHIRRIQQSKT